MNLTQAAAKLTTGKQRMLRVLGGLAIAGAASMAAVPTAGAQVSFGVAIGGPRVYAPAPVYVAPGYRTYGYGNGYVGNTWGRTYNDGWRAREYRDREFRDRRAQNWYNDRRYDDRHYDNRGWR